MTIRTVTWNIGGGKLLAAGKDPTNMASYSVDGIDTIARQLQDLSPDIITMQEAHGDEEGSQIAKVAKHLGYDHYFYDPVSDSHIDPTQKLGNGIISKYPLSNIYTGRFFNPNISFDLEGMKAITHDKGFCACDITINNTVIHTTTLHLIPFRSVGLELDSETAEKILSTVSSKLISSTLRDFELIQGDFNISESTVNKYLPQLFVHNDLSEVVVEVPTTPTGRTYDHVLYKGLALAKYSIDSSAPTDHYPVVCDFVL